MDLNLFFGVNVNVNVHSEKETVNEDLWMTIVNAAR